MAAAAAADIKRALTALRASGARTFARAREAERLLHAVARALPALGHTVGPSAYAALAGALAAAALAASASAVTCAASAPSAILAAGDTPPQAW